MFYVQPDINEIGDKRLDEKETVARERESLLNEASTRKIYGQAELEDAERSCGSRMAWQEILRRLYHCNHSLYMTDSQGGKHVAIYRPKRRGEDDESERDPEKRDWWNDHKYVGGMPKEHLPEWSHVILDSSMLPVREIRGWRSVLMSLIKSGAITYTAARKHFGEPIHDARSGRWNSQLKLFKPK